MYAVPLVSNFYSALATAVLFLHGLFIFSVIVGALLVRSRPILRWLHIASLVWGILTELLPWPCPLTLLWSYRQAYLLPHCSRSAYHEIASVSLGVCYLSRLPLAVV